LRVRRRLRVVAYTDSTEVGGAEHALAHLLEAIDDSVEVSVLGVSEPVVSRVAGAKQTSLVSRPRAVTADVRSFREHMRALRTLRPDILHANLISPFACQYAVAAAAALAIRSVAVYQLPNRPSDRLQRVLKLLTARATSAHVGVGAGTSREIEALLRLRPGTVRTIHNGVPDAGVSERAISDASAPTVGFTGRLVRQKGLDVLIRALADVPAVRTVLVGQGEEEASLRELAHRLGVADRIEFRGWTHEPRRLLSSFDIFVLPSRFEGFPLAVLEAQLAELPVVAADVGSVGEAVVTGTTGILVPPDDPASLAAALASLAADPDRRRALGRSGRERVLAHFTADRMAAGYERLYAELVD
jgi:glycosyltransferase involved in cell wall biosynthesis